MFAVIIPTYLSSELIKIPVQSLNSQTFRDFEVVFADDCSPDFDALKYNISEIANFEYKVVQLPYHKNQVGARKLGADTSSGEYICFLDHDDAWRPEKLELVREAILAEKDPLLTLFYHRLICRKVSGRCFLYPKRGKKTGETVAEYLFYSNGLMQSSALCFHRSTLNKIYFDDTAPPHDDWDFVLEAERAGCSYAFIEQSLAEWNVRRMAGKSERDRAVVSMKWYAENAASFSPRARTAFFINIVLPKLLAEGKVFSASQLLVQQFLTNPWLAALSVGRLFERVLAKG